MTKLLRELFNGILSHISERLIEWHIHPNTITIAGVIGNCFAALVIARGEFIVGGIIVCIMGFMDALDGSVARASGRPKRFGAMLDSFSDRLSEILIYTGLLFYLLELKDRDGILLVFAALTGSLLVSYVRSRAESLNIKCEVGLMTRLERYIVTVVMLLSGFIKLGLSIIAFLSYLTAIHRMFFSWRQIENED